MCGIVAGLPHTVCEGPSYTVFRAPCSHHQRTALGTRDCRMNAKLGVRCQPATMHEVSKLQPVRPLCSEDTHACQHPSVRAVQCNHVLVLSSHTFITCGCFAVCDLTQLAVPTGQACICARSERPGINTEGLSFCVLEQTSSETRPTPWVLLEILCTHLAPPQQGPHEIPYCSLRALLGCWEQLSEVISKPTRCQHSKRPRQPLQACECCTECHSEGTTRHARHTSNLKIFLSSHRPSLFRSP